VVTVLALLLVAFAGGPRLVRRRGIRLTRDGGAERLLAGSRLAAEPGSAGRVAAVLMVCGVALGVEAVIVSDLLLERGQLGEDKGFYLTGFGMAAVGVLVAAAVGVLTLVVGAADQLLDARRPLASLRAQGVEESTLTGVLRRQLSAAAVPGVVFGTVIGGVAAAILDGSNGGDSFGQLPGAVLPTLATALVAGVVVSFAARGATRLLRSRLRAAVDPENLRVA
jgi:hypothetical protein